MVSSVISADTVQNLTAVILLWIQAVLINNVCIEHKLSRDNSLFPGLFYVIFISYIPESLTLHPVLLANTFLIAGFVNIIQSSKHVDIRHYLFNGGLFLTLSMLIFPSYVLFIAVGLFGFYNMKSLKTAGNIQFITGILTSLFLIFGLQYLTEGKWDFQFFYSPVWQSALSILPDARSWTFIIVFAVSLLASLWFYPELITKKNIQSRKKIEIFYLIQLSVFLSTIFFFHNTPLELMTVAFPVGTLVGLRLSEIKSPLIVEIIHLVLIGGLLYNHYTSFNI
jgi:hypothetical protein